MKTELLEKAKKLAEEFGGTLQQLSTLDHSGRTSEKIVIEYNVQQKDKSCKFFWTQLKLI